jgi:hypothetical protein
MINPEILCRVNALQRPGTVINTPARFSERRAVNACPVFSAQILVRLSQRSDA